MYALNTKPLPDVSFKDPWLVNDTGSTLERADGAGTVSCNPPDGHLETRVVGQKYVNQIYTGPGVYEFKVTEGGTATFMPRPGEVYVFAIKKVPNA